MNRKQNQQDQHNQRDPSQQGQQSPQPRPSTIRPMVSPLPTATLIAGIDISSKSNQIALMLGDGTKIGSSQNLPNNLPGARQLRDLLVETAKKSNCSHIRVGMEATGLYWYHLHQFLLEEVTLKGDFHIQVTTLNPKLIARFKKAYGDMDKTDPIDAMIIAERIRVGRLPISHLIDEQYEPLKRLTRFRFQLVQSLIRQQSLFLSTLFLKYSAWQQLKPFSSTFGVTAQELIQEEDPESLIKMSLPDLVEKVVRPSRNRLVDPEKTAKLVKRVAKYSYRLKPTLKEPIDLILINGYETIKFFKEKINGFDQVIEKEFAKYENPLTSIKGMGLVFGAGITAELGSTSRFTNQSAAGKYAGLTWRKRSSGNFTAEETPLRRTGNSYLRYYLVQAANSLRVHNAKYQAYYQKKYQEVPKHQHKRALVLTARKLLRLCFAMLRDQSLYQPTWQGKESTY